MRRSISILWVLMLVSVIPSFGQNTAKPSHPARLRVYYFHTEERCPIDQSVEDNTRMVMNSNYKDKIQDGTIDFRIINTDVKANEALASKFDINAQALYLVKVEKGKETNTDLTKFAFDWSLGSPLKFRKGLKDEVDKLLK
jgi:hypothetical protein